MQITFDVTLNFTGLITSLIAIGVVGLLIYRFYKKQQKKFKLWKIVLITLVGFFAFSINFASFKLAILPIGVWIIYFFLKGEHWQYYRAYAWLGFWANYLFLLTSLIAMPLEQFAYPEEELATYMSNVDEAFIVETHPSATKVSFNKSSFSLKDFEQKQIDSHNWYNSIILDFLPNERRERFPYQLVGTASKWGSGLEPVIYIEEDGKGILITSPKGQFYFRSDYSVIGEVSSDE